MFAKLTGTIDSISEHHLVLDVNGVGYLVGASARTLAGLTVGQSLALKIETQVREDAINLFGFTSTDELRWFQLLHQVQGVGAKVALSVLSILTPAELALAVAVQDKASVGRANGVGPKLAMRIVNELKDKAPAPLGGTVAGAAPGSGSAGESGSVAGSGTLNDATSALLNLGFRPAEAASAVERATAQLGERAHDPANLQALIGAALKAANALR